MSARQTPSIDTLSELGKYLPVVKTEIRAMVQSVCGKHHMPERIASRVDEYYAHCLDYNIVGGKLARARTVCETLSFCNPDQVNADSGEFKAAMVLGWCVEILQAFFLIEDDVMDGGEMRRGKPCWYRVPGVGIANAVNDGLFLEQVLYELIELNPTTKDIAVPAQRILRNAALRTVIGQHLDTCPPTDVKQFDREQWLSIVRFKTAFYTFWLPCELGILVSGKEFLESDIAELRNISLLLGELFQAQDDMLDCFGDPAVIGKVGRDIEEGKCTWLLYTALEATKDDVKLHGELVELFRSDRRVSDPVIVQRIKQIYRQVDMECSLGNYTEELTREIKTRTNGMTAEELRNLATWLLNSTTNRKK